MLSPDVFVTDQGTRDVVHMCPTPNDLKQEMYGHDKGFALTLYKLPDTMGVIMLCAYCIQPFNYISQIHGLKTQ